MVAIPLEQGRFFNWSCSGASTAPIVAIPLEQGRFFNYELDVIGLCCESQSLWSRDGFSITSWTLSDCAVSRNPFGAGTVFQWDFFINLNDKQRRNPFGAGTVFQ